MPSAVHFGIRWFLESVPGAAFLRALLLRLVPTGTSKPDKRTDAGRRGESSGGGFGNDIPVLESLSVGAGSQDVPPLEERCRWEYCLDTEIFCQVSKGHHDGPGLRPSLFATGWVCKNPAGTHRDHRSVVVIVWNKARGDHLERLHHFFARVGQHAATDTECENLKFRFPVLPGNLRCRNVGQLSVGPNGGARSDELRSVDS